MEQEAGKLMELDYLYKTADKLYMQFARSCGLSTCAYWMLYDLELAGGTVPLRRLCDAWSYSKQTINSALKALEARELITLSLCEGSRKNKAASLTEAGRAFSAANIVPSILAERRAFCQLSSEERETILTLVRKYTAALESEFAAMQAERSEANGERA